RRDGSVPVADGDDGPDHLLEVRPRIDPWRRELEGRAPAEPDDQEQDAQDADPERRDGESSDADYADHVVDPGVLANSGEHAEGTRHDHGNPRRRER